VRDPSVNVEVEAAIAAAAEEFRWLKRLGWFPKKKSPVEPDPLLRLEALDRVEELADEVMPAHLRAHISGLLAQTPGGSKLTYAAGRDPYIADAVYWVTRCGFPATRNDATRERGEPASESACSIVQKALVLVGVNMRERSIEAIWIREARRSPEESRK
jgi:hypothetical protein